MFFIFKEPTRKPWERTNTMNGSKSPVISRYQLCYICVEREINICIFIVEKNQTVDRKLYKEQRRHYNPIVGQPLSPMIFLLVIVLNSTVCLLLSDSFSQIFR